MNFSSIEKEYSALQLKADEELQRIGRKTLRRCSTLNECIAAMSMCFLTAKNGGYVDIEKDHRVAEFRNAIDIYSGMFNDTFGPWRFTKDGEIITEWGL